MRRPRGLRHQGMKRAVATTQAGEQNHELALEYCLGNLHHHHFGDVNPAEVEDNYDRCVGHLSACGKLAYPLRRLGR